MHAAQSAAPAMYRRDVATLEERVDEVLRVRGWSERDWLARANLSHGVIAFWRARLKQDPAAGFRKDSEKQLAHAAGVHLRWFRTGAGPRDVPGGPPQPDEAPTTAPEPESMTFRVAAGDEPEARFGNLVEWPTFLVAATRARPNHPAWVWERVARIRPFLLAQPNAEMVAAVADLVWTFERAKPDAQTQH